LYDRHFSPKLYKKSREPAPGFFDPADSSRLLSVLGAMGSRHIGFDGLFIADF
jgi:hypothetical protein